MSAMQRVSSARTRQVRPSLQSVSARQVPPSLRLARQVNPPLASGTHAPPQSPKSGLHAPPMATSGWQVPAAPQ